MANTSRHFLRFATQLVGKTRIGALGLCMVCVPALAQNAPLRVRLNADIRSTDPGVNRDANSDAVVFHLMEGLVALKEDTSVAPMLASRVDVASDGLSYTFRLREGIKFHNGAPLTAEDVVWAFKRYMEPATQWRCLSELDGRGASKVVDIAASDAKTVVFKLEKPSALFLTTLARPDCGGAGIYHRSSVGADGKWKEPVGTGPYKLTEWKRGQFIDLARFDNYTARTDAANGLAGAKKPLVEKIRFVVVPDSAAAKAALLTGTLDLIPDINVSEMGDLIGKQDLKVATITTASVSAILFQTRDPLLKDVRVRRALALAIDGPELVRGTTNALGRRNNSAIPVTSAFHTAAHKVSLNTNLVEARRLLAEAGYTGQPIKMITNARYRSMFDTAVIAQAQAAKVGIKIDIEVLDWATQLDRYAKGDYQAMAFSYSARLDPSLSYEMFTGPKDTQPRKVWDNPQVQALLNESMATTDIARRQAIFDELHARMLRDAPLIVLWNGVQIVAQNKRVTGFNGWAVEMPRLWNVAMQ